MGKVLVEVFAMNGSVQNQCGDSYERHLLELSYKSLALTGDFYDKLIYKGMLADAAIAGLIINQMDTILKFFDPVGIKSCFWFLLISAICGLLALFPSFMRKSMLVLQTTFTNELRPRNPKDLFNQFHWMESFFKPLPWFTCFGKLWLRWRGIEPQAAYDKAAYWSLQQMFLTFFQVWTLVAAVVLLLWFFNLPSG